MGKLGFPTNSVFRLYVKPIEETAMAELPPIGQDNSSSNQNQNSEPNKIVWVESGDVYKPIPKSIEKFKSERGITNTKKEKVYITIIALRNLIAHLSSNTTVEKGGILFGNAYVDPDYKVYVEIKSAVAAPSTIGTGAHLEFTSASWQGIMDYAKTTHPQENIVGWYHSHPNLGVFMSGTDRNTQRAFFYHPWCVSIVYDPVRGEIAYFLGDNAIQVNVVEFGGGDTENIMFSDPEDKDPDPRIESSQEEETNNEVERSVPEPEQNLRNNKIVFLALPLLLILIVIVIPNFLLKDSFKNPINQPNLNNLPQVSNRQEANGNVTFSDTYTEGNYEFYAEYITMGTETYRTLEANQNVLHVPIIKPKTQIGSGDEIILLIIGNKSNNSIAKNVTLEMEKFHIKNKSKEIPLVDSVRVSDNMQLDKLSSKRKVIKENLGSLSNGRAVLVLISSSYISNFQQGVAPNFQQRVVRDIVNIPRRVIYEDSEGNQKSIKVAKILQSRTLVNQDTKIKIE